MPWQRWIYPWTAILAGAVTLGRCYAVICTFNHTIDEPYHIGSAVVLYEAHKLVAGAQHPPLARLVAGLPLILQGVRLPEARDEDEGVRSPIVEYVAFGIGQELIFSGKLPYWQMLISARTAMLLFPALAMFYLYKLGRWLAGPLAAMLAVVFFSVDPTFLGHSPWVGTDAAGCAGFVAGLYYGLRFVARPNRSRAAICGIALALAISCKYSCVLLIPSLLLIVIVRALIGNRRMLNRLARPSLWLILIVIGFATLWATFLFDVGPMRIQGMLTDDARFWSQIPQAVKQMPIPMPSFWLGYLFLLARTNTGHATYLNGQISFSGWWNYFPEALLVKCAIGFLIALLVSLVVLVLDGKRRLLRSMVLVLPAGFFFAMSMAGKYQLGIRHLLPILPLLYLLIAMQLSRGKRVVVLLALILLAATETALVHPDYLAFFNLASGGPSRGERYLIDSNLDWGQDINRLAQWLKTDARGRQYSIRCFNASESLLRELGLDPNALSGEPRGLLAVSKNVKHRLEGAMQQPDGSLTPGPDYTWVEKYPLIKHIGYSIDVYDLDAR